jgi:hypothetical protein
MTTATFNTLKFVRRLTDAGIPREHAEAEADALSEVLEVNLKDLAAKSDLRELRAEIKADVSDAKSDIIKWLAGLLLAQAALVATLVKLL